MTLAIFDLDETLIGADSDHEWGQYLVNAGLVDPLSHQASNDSFYADYKAGRLDIDAYLQFACSVLSQYSVDELKVHREKFVTERIKPLVLPKAIALVNKHREKGDFLMVITSTIEFVTEPIVELFGIETLIAPIPELVADRYTGNIIGCPSFAAGKVTRLHEWLETSQQTMTGSYFYSDSHNDLPLLRIVDNPVAVDPDNSLRFEAMQKKWQIISLRD